MDHSDTEMKDSVLPGQQETGQTENHLNVTVNFTCFLFQFQNKTGENWHLLHESCD